VVFAELVVIDDNTEDLAPPAGDGRRTIAVASVDAVLPVPSETIVLDDFVLANAEPTAACVVGDDVAGVVDPGVRANRVVLDDPVIGAVLVHDIAVDRSDIVSDRQVLEHHILYPPARGELRGGFPGWRRAVDDRRVGGH